MRSKQPAQANVTPAKASPIVSHSPPLLQDFVALEAPSLRRLTRRQRLADDEAETNGAARKRSGQVAADEAPGSLSVFGALNKSLLHALKYRGARNVTWASVHECRSTVRRRGEPRPRAFAR